MTRPRPLTRTRALTLARTLGHDPASWFPLDGDDDGDTLLYQAVCQRAECNGRLVERDGTVQWGAMLRQACPLRATLGLSERRWRGIGR